MERLEQRFKSLEKDILDPKSVLHVDGLLVSREAASPAPLGRVLGRVLPRY